MNGRNVEGVFFEVKIAWLACYFIGFYVRKTVEPKFLAVDSKWFKRYYSIGFSSFSRGEQTLSATAYYSFVLLRFSF